MKKIMTMLASISCAVAIYGNDTVRLEELERICAFVPCDDLRVQEVIPTPDDIIAKYHITTNQLIADLKSLVMKYDSDEVDERGRQIRARAVSNLGRYCTTNELSFLTAIMTNSADYAQSSAIGTSIRILTHSPDLVVLARGIVTNNTVYSKGLRDWACHLLSDKCQEGGSNLYIADPARRAEVAAFFIEQAGINTDMAITMDILACEHNPWYRHSQQRQDNLARLRPPGLTGRPKEIYDAAQRDAAQED